MDKAINQVKGTNIAQIDGASVGVIAGRVKGKVKDIAQRFIGGGMLKCAICSQPARVMKTEKEKLEDGRMLITRQVRCTGKNRHTYPLKDMILSQNRKTGK